MAQIEIKENTDNLKCEIFGCGNDAKFRIGSEGESPRQQIVYCEECLQGIINAAPIELIMNRPEFADIDEDDEGVKNVGEAQEVNLNVLSSMKFNDLKELAKDRGITVPFGTSRDELIKLLSGE